jgi:hypothetical protein
MKILQRKKLLEIKFYSEIKYLLRLKRLNLVDQVVLISFGQVIWENPSFPPYVEERVLSMEILHGKKLLESEFYLGVGYFLRSKRL